MGNRVRRRETACGGVAWTHCARGAAALMLWRSDVLLAEAPDVFSLGAVFVRKSRRPPRKGTHMNTSHTRAMAT